MINEGVTGPFDIKFLDNRLLEETENDHIRLTALGHMYFAVKVGEYAKTQCPFGMKIDDEIAFHEELGLVEARGNLIRPLPFGISKIFKDLEFDEMSYEIAVEVLRVHPEFENMVRTHA
mgnify:CR=1 FL=1